MPVTDMFDAGCEVTAGAGLVDFTAVPCAMGFADFITVAGTWAGFAGAAAWALVLADFSAGGALVIVGRAGTDAALGLGLGLAVTLATLAAGCLKSSSSSERSERSKSLSDSLLSSASDSNASSDDVI